MFGKQRVLFVGEVSDLCLGWPSRPRRRSPVTAAEPEEGGSPLGKDTLKNMRLHREARPKERGPLATGARRPSSPLCAAKGLTALWAIGRTAERAAFDTYIDTQLSPSLVKGDVVILGNLLRGYR